MSAIKKPVRAYQLRNGNWTLSQADNSPLHYEGTEDHAKEIELAVNLHDQLVSALFAARRRLLHVDSTAVYEPEIWKQIESALARAKTDNAKNL